MGLTVLDAGVVIGLLDPHDAHHEAAIDRLTAASRRRDDLLLPASAYAECLVGPARRGPDAVAHVRALLLRLPLPVHELGASVAEIAADLRARHGGRLKLPDALVVATAIDAEADVLITTDRGWPSAGDLSLTAMLDVI